MNKHDQLWMKLMDWCSKYWGCHQLPDRSFFYKGYQIPVCARCTGIIIGYFISIIYAILFHQLKITTSIVLIMFMAIDGTLQLLTAYSSTNTKRLITGMLAGFGFIQLMKSFIFLLI